jgi:hypothetical protein
MRVEIAFGAVTIEFVVNANVNVEWPQVPTTVEWLIQASDCECPVLLLLLGTRSLY